MHRNKQQSESLIWAMFYECYGQLIFKTMEDKFEKLGQLIDSIDSLAHGLNIPMPAEFHIQQLKTILPEKVKELKESFVEIAGENPWD